MDAIKQGQHAPVQRTAKADATNQAVSAPAKRTVLMAHRVIPVEVDVPALINANLAVMKPAHVMKPVKALNAKVLTNNARKASALIYAKTSLAQI